MFANLLILIFGVFCCSTAVIFIRQSGEHPVLLAAYRLLVAAVALTPLFWRDYRRQHEYSFRELGRVAAFPGIVLGVHFISWIMGARLATASNASLIVNLVPLSMPLFAVYLLREHLTASEVAGTACAGAGTMLLFFADFNLSITYFWGDLLCFASMLFYSYYLALGRKNRRIPSLWLYVVPLYYLAGIFCFLVALGFTNPIKPYSLRDIGLILGLGFVPTVIGHSVLNYAMKCFKSQVVSIVNMGQFIFAGIMAFFLLHEAPHLSFYLASVLIVTGAVITVRGAKTAR